MPSWSGAHARRVWPSRILGGVMVAMTIACASEVPTPQVEALPRAEFLLAAGDSTYWVRSDSGRVRVRSAPVLLTMVDGALVELFLTDEGTEFAEASFLSTRLWARPIVGQDSLVLHTDETVSRELAQWRRRFPGEPELAPDDEAASEEPATVVHEVLDLLDVHGPYVTIERQYDADIADGPPHQHATERFVVDVRTGTRQTLATLFGAEAATRVEREARVALQQLLDSTRTAGERGDARARAAQPTLASFRFLPTSFAITDRAGVPSVEYLVPGRGLRGEALTMRLPTIAVQPPTWWTTVRSTLPTWTADSAVGTFRHAPYVVRVRRDGTTSLAVTLTTPQDSAAAVTPLLSVEGPVYQLIPLDGSAIDRAARSALARTFDAATMQDAGAEQASLPRGRPRRSSPSSHSAFSYVRAIR